MLIIVQIVDAIASGLLDARIDQSAKSVIVVYLSDLPCPFQSCLSWN